MEPIENPTANIPKKKKKKTGPIILIILLLSGSIYALKTYLYNRNHINTDDAQVEGNISPVLPRISGYVNDIRFEDNQLVHKGDTLIVLDDRDLQIKVLQAEAALANAKANVEVVKANTGSAQATVMTAKSNVDLADVNVKKTKIDLDRSLALLKEHATTQSMVDGAKAQYDAAVSGMEVAKKQYEATQKQNSAALEGIKVATSIVAQRQADLDFAELQLSYAAIIAPLDGMVSKKNVQPGQFVQAGQALFSIVDEVNIWIVANFKETQLEKMNPGQPVDVKVDAFENLKITGEVTSFSGATGARFALLPPDNSTGNFVKVVQRVPVKIKITTDKMTATKLRPGMSVSVTVNTESK
ncbi:HlyD family secretion protein [soil metagenome]